jgi:hypothetical protein
MRRFSCDLGHAWWVRVQLETRMSRKWWIEKERWKREWKEQKGEMVGDKSGWARLSKGMNTDIRVSATRGNGEIIRYNIDMRGAQVLLMFYLWCSVTVHHARSLHIQFYFKSDLRNTWVANCQLAALEQDFLVVHHSKSMSRFWLGSYSLVAMV